MILQSIVLRNFRQYYGSQVIDFSQSAEKNVTVIHGENGSGKTALLNAFSWCLYGQINLPNKSQIANEHAISELALNGEIECYVTIKFTEKVPDGDYEKYYTLTRTITARKISKDKVVYSEPEAKLSYTEDGKLEVSIGSIANEISRILPEQLSSYFFFDGERIDNLSKDSGTEEVKDAIKTIMGLEILERSINHTEASKRKFMSELKLYGNAQTINLVNEIEKIQYKLEELKSEEQEVENSIKLTRKHIADTENRLRQIEGSKYLQMQRDQKNKEMVQMKEELLKTTKQLTQLMSKYGYLAFTSIPFVKVQELLMEQNFSESSYTGVNRTFINRLLDNHECICGTNLAENSEEYDRVAAVKDHLGPVSADHTVSELKAGMRVIEEKKDRLFEEMDRLKQLEYTLGEKIRVLKEEMDDIGDKILDKDSEEIYDLEEKRKTLIQKDSFYNRKLGGINSEVDRLAMELKEKENERGKIQQKVQKAELAEKRIQTCNKLIEVMKHIFDIREESVRNELQERVSNVYRKFLRKGYNVNLSTDYKLEVVNDRGNKVGMSQGERQITSLSFIGAIVDIAREQYNRELKSTFEEGGIYPIVMDSPFGALDSNHRERVAKGIPSLAEQIIVIVSTSQWRGEVEQHLSDRIGKEYHLHYNDPRNNEKEPYEFTQIREVQ